MIDMDRHPFSRLFYTQSIECAMPNKEMCRCKEKWNLHARDPAYNISSIAAPIPMCDSFNLQTPSPIPPTHRVSIGELGSFCCCCSKVNAEAQISSLAFNIVRHATLNRFIMHGHNVHTFTNSPIQ